MSPSRRGPKRPRTVPVSPVSSAPIVAHSIPREALRDLTIEGCWLVGWGVIVKFDTPAGSGELELSRACIDIVCERLGWTVEQFVNETCTTSGARTITLCVLGAGGVA